MRSKVSVLIIVITSIFLLVQTYSFASSFKFNAEANKIEVEPGEEVTIDLSLSDIDMGIHGINVVEGYMNYDEDFFSDFKFENVNGWEITHNNEEGERKGKFLIAKMVEGIQESEKINKIIVKVRSDLTEGEGHIRLKNIQSNDGENLVSEGDRIITIKIKSKEGPKNEIENKIQNEIRNEVENKTKNETNNITNQNTSNNVVNNTQKSIENKTSDEKNTNNSVITNDGIAKVIENVRTSDNIIFIIAGMFLVILVNVFIFIINKREKKKDKKE